MADIYQSYNGHICWLWSLMAIGAAKFESQRSHNLHTKRGFHGYLRHSGRQQVRCNLLNMQAAASEMKAEGY